MATLEEDGSIQEAGFYCWQHKDQAAQAGQQDVFEKEEASERRLSRRRTELYPLKEKSSIDTMVQRLGIDAAGGDKKSQKKHTRNPEPPKKTHTTDFAADARLPNQALYAEKCNLGQANEQCRPRQKKPGFWASFCCMGNADDDYVEIVRHKKRVEQTPMSQPMFASRPLYGATSTRPSSMPATAPPRRTVAPSRHSLSDHAQYADKTTSDLLSLIPTRLSPQTTSALFAELTKPVTASDEEGYIYVFWLTPQSKDAPDESTARSLLPPSDTSRRPRNGRKISDVMTEFSFEDDDLESQAMSPQNAHSRGKKQTIMLKIGRASNITRRMNEWQRQCGYALNLVRWYPYVSSSSPPSPQQERRPLYPDLSRPAPNRRQSSADAVRKVPCVKRVERLIHLELAEKQVKRQCTACGKEHREWFKVEASQAGVKAVDEVIRRWVGWGETQTDYVVT